MWFIPVSLVSAPQYVAKSSSTWSLVSSPAWWSSHGRLAGSFHTLGSSSQLQPFSTMATAQTRRGDQFSSCPSFSWLGKLAFNGRTLACLPAVNLPKFQALRSLQSMSLWWLRLLGGGERRDKRIVGSKPIWETPVRLTVTRQLSSRAELISMYDAMGPIT